MVWCWVAVVVVMVVRGSDGGDDVMVALTVTVAGVVIAILVVTLVLVMVVILLWFGAGGISVLDDNIVEFAGDQWLTASHSRWSCSSLCRHYVFPGRRRSSACARHVNYLRHRQLSVTRLADHHLVHLLLLQVSPQLTAIGDQSSSASTTSFTSDQ